MKPQQTSGAYILSGIPVTLSYTGVSLVLGFIWDVCLAFFKEGPFSMLKWLGRFYTSLFRGTPLLLQLTLIYYATPQITGYDIATWQAVILAFTLNSGAYVSESIRGGIQSVDKGQTEAALSLGLSYGATMKDIILPQAIRNILPSLVNESIDLLKESALVSVIGGADILRRANIVASKKYLFFEPLLIPGLLYYVLVMVLTIGAHFIEKKLKRS